MAVHKLKWTVGEPPTGPYRSFQKRMWPSAFVGDKAAINIRCEDSYIPSRARTGNHKELTVNVAHHEGSTFTWKTLKTRAATLDEAKALAQEFVDKNPSFFGLTS